MERSSRGPGRQRSRAIRIPITTTMAQSRPFLIPADDQCGFQLAGVPAWLSAGIAAGALFSEVVPAPRCFTERTVVNAPVQEPLRSDLRRHDDDRYRRGHLYTALHLAGCPMLRVLQSGEPSRPATAERANEQHWRRGYECRRDGQLKRRGESGLLLP